MPMKKHTDAEIIEAYEQVGTKLGAARLLGVDERSYRKRLNKLLLAKDYSVPEDFSVSRITELQRDDGKPSIRWVRKDRDKEQQEELFKVVKASFLADLPKSDPFRVLTDPLKDHNKDLINLYVVTDYHLGMKAWHEETGADWDTSIAEDLLVKWFGAAVRQAPNSEIGLLAILGDFLHWDGMDAVTPTSRHLLDADTRFAKIVRVAIRVIRQIVNMLLAKHGYVHIKAAEGNHDPASSIWLRELLNVFYEDDKRVTVDTSPDPYYVYEHGQTALFFHHGHKRKVGNVDSVFVAKFREIFGRTKHAYAHMGHLHSVDIKETNLMVVEQHRTLAAPDAYASRGGWISGRDAQVITYHKEYGHTGRVVISPEMVA